MKCEEFSVATHSEFQTAANSVAQRPTRITIQPMSLDKQLGIYIPPGEYVELVGGAALKPLDLNMTGWDGDWSANPKTRNGIDINTKRVVLRNLHWRNYEWLGAAIKCQNACEELTIIDCGVSDSGNQRFPDKVPNPTNSGETWYSQGLSCSGLATQIRIMGFSANRCCTHTHWAHPMYLRGHISITRMDVRECGSSVTFGNAESVSITHSQWSSPKEHWDSVNKKWELPYVFTIPAKGMRFVRNVILGKWQCAYNQGNKWNPTLHTFQNNNYVGAAWERFFMRNPAGNPLTQQEAADTLGAE